MFVALSSRTNVSGRHVSRICVQPYQTETRALQPVPTRTAGAGLVYATPPNFRRSTKPKVPVAGAIGGAGFHAGSRYRYEVGSRWRSPTRTSATMREPTGPIRSALFGGSS